MVAVQPVNVMVTSSIRPESPVSLLTTAEGNKVAVLSSTQLVELVPAPPPSRSSVTPSTSA